MLTLGLLGEHVAPFYSKTKLSLALMSVCVICLTTFVKVLDPFIFNNYACIQR
jgi:hypothetical protein